MDTPQNRIIFYSLHNGAPLTWQSRYPERLSTTACRSLPSIPYAWGGRWDRVAVRSNSGAAWMPVPPFDEVDAKYSSREMIG